jgi:hypothetical protein
MQSIKEILTETPYTGSEATKALLLQQIEERWGKSELKNYDPKHNARTYKSWVLAGFKVRKGEKALKSITFIETKDAAGNVLKKYRRPVSLFYYRQVEPLQKPSSLHEQL